MFQIPIYLPGGVKYIVDFVEFMADENVNFVDVKGYRTPQYKIKKKLVEALYPFKIIENHIEIRANFDFIKAFLGAKSRV